MSDELFHFVTITIQIVTFGALIFGGGRYIGTITESLKNLISGQKIFETSFADHLTKDETSFKSLNENLTDIKIDIAVIKTSLDDKPHGKSK